MIIGSIKNEGLAVQSDPEDAEHKPVDEIGQICLRRNLTSLRGGCQPDA
jgi:hypothetical protein